MEFTKSKLTLIREALSYGLMFSRKEAETAEFALLLVEVAGAIEAEKTQPPKEKTYEFVVSERMHQQGIKCLTCNRTSYNTNDIKNLYCGFCNKFHN